MHKIQVKFRDESLRKYNIYFNEQYSEAIKKLIPKKTSKVIIITDIIVKRLYLKQLSSPLTQAGYSVLNVSIPAGEASKSYQNLCYLHEQLLKKKCDRNSIILALGGGVVGDLAGFVAATYMRGISYIQIPTTFLAMIDSSVGGKTGINTDYGKNLIGAFWQPHAVIINTNFLETLPKRHLINGLIEAVKIFLTCDQKSFRFVERHVDLLVALDKKYLLKLMMRAITLKAEVVAKDEREANYRAILNFGHTIGHALEKISSYRMLHGLAVGYGILVESTIATQLNLLPKDQLVSIFRVLQKLGITKKIFKMDKINNILEAARYDKKNSDHSLSFILLSDIGEVYEKQSRVVHGVPVKIVKQALIEVLGANNGR